MSVKIETGQYYLLDGKTLVKVLKAVNRSLTIFNIEIPGQRIESVEVQRLHPVKEKIEGASLSELHTGNE